jgi:hypothetical protein
MKARNIPVTHVTIRQPKEETLLLINNRGMKARISRSGHLTRHKLSLHAGNK